MRPQRTLKRQMFYSGIGIHSGQEVELSFCPAPPHSGIVFQRMDLPHKPIIPATVEYVQDTARSTTIGRDDVNKGREAATYVPTGLWGEGVESYLYLFFLLAAVLFALTGLLMYLAHLF